MALKPSDWLLDPQNCPGYIKNEVIAEVEKGETRHHTEYLHVNIPSRYALVNINAHVEAVVDRAGVLDGTVFITTKHITTGLYINDAESGLLHDIALWIENLAPFGRTGPGPVWHSRLLEKSHIYIYGLLDNVEVTGCGMQWEANFIWRKDMRKKILGASILGLSALISGSIVYIGSDNLYHNYAYVGYISIVIALFTIYLLKKIKVAEGN